MRMIAPVPRICTCAWQTLYVCYILIWLLGVFCLTIIKFGIRMYLRDWRHGIPYIYRYTTCCRLFCTFYWVFVAGRDNVEMKNVRSTCAQQIRRLSMSVSILFRWCGVNYWVMKWSLDLSGEHWLIDQLTGYTAYKMHLWLAGCLCSDEGKTTRVTVTWYRPKFLLFRCDPPFLQLRGSVESEMVLSAVIMVIATQRTLICGAK